MQVRWSAAGHPAHGYRCFFASASHRIADKTSFVSSFTPVKPPYLVYQSPILYLSYSSSVTENVYRTDRPFFSPTMVKR